MDSDAQADRDPTESAIRISSRAEGTADGFGPGFWRIEDWGAQSEAMEVVNALRANPAPMGGWQERPGLTLQDLLQQLPKDDPMGEYDRLHAAIEAREWIDVRLITKESFPKDYDRLVEDRRASARAPWSFDPKRYFEELFSDPENEKRTGLGDDIARTPDGETLSAFQLLKREWERDPSAFARRMKKGMKTPVTMEEVPAWKIRSRMSPMHVQLVYEMREIARADISKRLLEHARRARPKEDEESVTEAERSVQALSRVRKALYDAGFDVSIDEFARLFDASSNAIKTKWQDPLRRSNPAMRKLIERLIALAPEEDYQHFQVNINTIQRE